MLRKVVLKKFVLKKVVLKKFVLKKVVLKKVFELFKNLRSEIVFPTHRNTASRYQLEKPMQ